MRRLIKCQNLMRTGLIKCYNLMRRLIKCYNLMRRLIKCYNFLRTSSLECYNFMRRLTKCFNFMRIGYLMRHSLFANEDGNGFRVLLEQASHEIHKGSYDIGLQYLNKALIVSLIHN
jgi:hypothetical protein